MDYAAGESWLKDTIQLGSSKKNPMQEFVMQLKTLLPGDSVIKD